MKIGNYLLSIAEDLYHKIVFYVINAELLIINKFEYKCRINNVKMSLLNGPTAIDGKYRFFCYVFSECF